MNKDDNYSYVHNDLGHTWRGIILIVDNKYHKNHKNFYCAVIITAIIILLEL
ncbi:hypothetical protein T492DRAFT_1021956 [Pavlovales sp. CCMP2436]|nr:hypothetical protein T492DRAFT_1021956 [Pavlovales sp. CCMP2436]